MALMCGGLLKYLSVTNDISFHARVGRFSPFLYLRSVAIAVTLFQLQLVVLVSPCFLGSRIPCDYRFPRAPLFLCSERKPSSLTTGSSKLQFGDRQTRVKTVHYSEDRSSRCDATQVLLEKGMQAWLLCLQLKSLNEFQFSV